jgi:Skp family chaperone for outer membrane proteins
MVGRIARRCCNDSSTARRSASASVWSSKAKLGANYRMWRIESGIADVLVYRKSKMFSAQVLAVAVENPKSELARLLKEQRQARQDEVYGGFSKSERAEYDTREERIHELDTQLLTMTSADEAASEQRREWNRTSETDTPQSEGRQPYRNREQDSTNAFTDSLKTGRTKQTHHPKSRD